VKIKITRAKATELLTERIDKGKGLLTEIQKTAHHYGVFEQLKRDLDKWRSFNEDLLKRIFEDLKIIQDYGGLSSGAFLLVAHDFSARYEGYTRELKDEIGYLEGCIDRLKLYEEPQVDAQSFDVGDAFSGLKAVTKIIESATKTILVVDGYVDHTTLDIISIKAAPVSVQLLTKAKSITAHFRVAAKAFAAQHGPLEIRASEKIHDRFLIVDGNQVYQSGASIKDLGKKASTLMAIADPNMGSAMQGVIQAYWAGSTPETF
jgi:hypothetical protein